MSPNAVAPHKRIEMCMAPCQVWKAGQPFAAIGIPGSHGILQTTLQMILNLWECCLALFRALEHSTTLTFRLLGLASVLASLPLSYQHRKS